MLILISEVGQLGTTHMHSQQIGGLRFMLPTEGAETTQEHTL